MILNNLHLFNSFFSRSPFGSLEGEGQGRSALCIPHFMIPTSVLFRILKIAFQIKDLIYTKIILLWNHLHFLSARPYGLADE
jgi:hypothetical protein